jgi:hypothetical protein
LRVLKILVESVGIKFNAKLKEQGESAVSCACQNGHDETLDVLFEMGARVNQTALPAAIRSGSLKCVEGLLKRKVKVTSEMVELATACGHTDVLGMIIGVCSDFGCSWLIAWSDCFRDGQRLLEAAGATPQWTDSGVRFLMRRPGSAAKFAGVAPLPETMVGKAGWKIGELQTVVMRVLREGTATAALVRALLERDWTHNGSPFARCSSGEFANLVFPPGVTSIGKFTFRCCSGLTQLQIPPSVTRIGSFAFMGCSSLAQVEIPPSMTTITGSAFRACSSLTRVEIPPSVTTIESCAFAGCDGLTRVEIPPSVTTIGLCAFSGCAALTQVEIPSSMKVIDLQAFRGVRKLERVTLVGSPLSQSVVAALEGCLMSTAEVVGAALAGQKFGRFTIAAA